MPPARTRLAAVSHCTVTQGPGAEVKGHPATMYEVDCVVTGRPLTRTRKKGSVGCASPPCEQSTVAPE
jgi:hypothetical protein